MFRYLEKSSEIASAQRKLEATIANNFQKSVVKDIGWPGGRVRAAKLLSNKPYWFWSQDHRGKDVLNPRRLNWFGTLSDNPGVSITVEINTNYSGCGAQASGFYAHDTSTNKIYLMHSGRVGGGEKGVGKQAFLAWATWKGQSLVDVVDSRRQTRQALVVMPVTGALAARLAIRYIDLVKEFKSAVRAGQFATQEFRDREKRFKEFYGEGRGRRKGSRSRMIDYISRHGEIVDALYNWRKSHRLSPLARIVKDIFIDMGVENGGRLVEVFEVKSGADRQLIYSALGQLMVHGSDRNCCKIIVLPEGHRLTKDLGDALKRLRIRILRFRLSEKAAVITGYDI